MLYQKVDELRKIKDLYLAHKSARSHVFGGRGRSKGLS